MNTKQLTQFLKKNPKKHLIFDLDETIAHLHIDWRNFRQQFHQVVTSLDHQFQPKSPAKGQAIHLYNHTIKQLGKEAKQALDEFCHTWEQEKLSDLTPNKSLITWIKENRNQYNYHLWTNNNRLTAQSAIQKLQMPNFFKHIVAKEDVMLSKPEPDGFHHIHNKVNAALDAYLFLGNSQHDKEAAKTAGIDFFLINMHQ